MLLPQLKYITRNCSLFFHLVRFWMKNSLNPRSLVPISLLPITSKITTLKISCPQKLLTSREFGADWYQLHWEACFSLVQVTCLHRSIASTPGTELCLYFMVLSPCLWRMPMNASRVWVFCLPASCSCEPESSGFPSLTSTQVCLHIWVLSVLEFNTQSSDAISQFPYVVLYPSWFYLEIPAHLWPITPFLIPWFRRQLTSHAWIRWGSDGCSIRQLVFMKTLMGQGRISKK